MKEKIEFKYSLEILASVAAVGGAVTVLFTFIIGKHYIIPTIHLTNTILIAHLAYFGFQDKRWAKYVLFWIATVISMHMFMGLFVAQVPREIFGNAFLPIYGTVCVIFGALAWKYVAFNCLFRHLPNVSQNAQQRL